MLDCDSRNIGSNPITHLVYTSLLLFQKTNQNLASNSINVFFFFEHTLKNHRLLGYAATLKRKQLEINLSGILKNFQKKQIHAYTKQLTALVSLLGVSLKWNVNKKMSNYVFYTANNTLKYNSISKAFSANFAFVYLAHKHNQFYLSITNKSNQCLITCSSGSIASLAHTSALENKVESISWKKIKKSKAFFNTLVQTFQKLFLVQKLKIQKNILVLNGKSRILIDFLTIFEYSFFFKWFFFFFFTLKKSFCFKNQKKKKAIKRRVFKKLISLDKTQYKHTKLYFDAHIIQ